MPSSAYIATGAICGFIAVMSLLSGNVGGALLFGLGVGINAAFYRHRVNREWEDAEWSRRQREV